MKNGICLCIGLMFSAVAWAQQLYQPIPNPQFSHQFTTNNENEYFFIDTSFRNLGAYYKWSFSGEDQFGSIRLGNLGQASNNLIYQSKRSIWDIYDFFGLQSEVLLLENVKQFYVRSPLTEAHYRMGYGRGQVFDIYHTQNVNEFWNVGVHYHRLNSIGNYTNELAKGYKFVANSKYFNPKSKTEVSTFYIQEKREIGQNGGIANINDFEENKFEDQILIPVNLEQDQRILKRRVVHNDVAFNLFQVGGVNDTTISKNSVGPTKMEKPFFKLGHSVKYEQFIETYQSFGETDFYQNSFFADDLFLDSNAFTSVENTVYLKGKIGNTSNLRLLTGIKHSYNEYSDGNFLLSGNNIGLVSRIGGTVRNIVDVKGKGEYILTGPLAGSVQIESSGELSLYKQLKGFGGYSVRSFYQNIKTQFYRSNHFIWRNNFGKTTENEFTYGVKWSKQGSFTVRTILINDYVYFNADAVPAQNNGLIAINQFELKQNFTFFKFIHFDNRVIYQTVADDNDVLPLPNFISRNALYFEFSLFKNELKCLLGTEVNYFSSYNSPSYNPATGTFYVENKYAIGNYPILNAFANFQLKSARFYLKYEHVNQGFTSGNYYAAPDYALPRRVFVVGIDWRFFN